MIEKMEAKTFQFSFHREEALFSTYVTKLSGSLYARADDRFLSSYTLVRVMRDCIAQNGMFRW